LRFLPFDVNRIEPENAAFLPFDVNRIEPENAAFEKSTPQKPDTMAKVSGNQTHNGECSKINQFVVSVQN